ncbi:MAG: hypothetical protein D4R77_02340 [Planctomycetaceae bacterium]|nr:MAG: hypothetical protein D4R77_02340 [Planctomycetaceae bacterium]
MADSGTRRMLRDQTPAPIERGRFLLMSCQGGAEKPLLSRAATLLPKTTPGVWRRGVVTLRLADGYDPPDTHSPDLIYARTVIRSFGQVTGETLGERIASLENLIGPGFWDDVHVWRRDERPAGAQPGSIRTPLHAKDDLESAHVRKAILSKIHQKESVFTGEPFVSSGRAAGNRVIAGSLVLDCVIDSHERWWVGWHRAHAPASCVPGGIFQAHETQQTQHESEVEQSKVSRAWYKLDEAIRFSGLAVRPGLKAVELGASPGGACQRLLEAGMQVVGIDPADMDPVVATHKRFEHWRKRTRDVRVRAFRPFDWIVADMNIDPTSTLEAIGRIVSTPGVRPQVIIATLKLPEWSRVDEVPEWLSHFEAWGYRPFAKQLSSAGREICVVAKKKTGATARRAAKRRRGKISTTPPPVSVKRPHRIEKTVPLPGVAELEKKKKSPPATRGGRTFVGLKRPANRSKDRATRRKDS